MDLQCNKLVLTEVENVLISISRIMPIDPMANLYHPSNHTSGLLYLHIIL